MKRAAVLLSLVLGACAPTLHPATAPTSRGFAQMVTAQYDWMDIDWVPSQFKTPEDPVAGPWYIYIGANGQYCPVSADQYLQLHEPNFTFTCEWRTPH